MQTLTLQQAFELAMQHHQAGRFAEAEPLYRQILSQQPNHADALHMLGLLALQVGKIQVASDLISRAIAINPSLPGYHYNFGLVLLRLGRFDEAAAAMESSIRLKPDFIDAWNNLGDARLFSSRLDEAMAAYREAIRLNPELPQGHFNLGNALQSREQFEQAVESYRRSLQLNPQFAEAWNNMSNALRRLAQIDQAIDACRKAIQLKPGFPEPYDNLGLCYRDRQQTDEAIDAFQTATRLSPRSAKVHMNLGNALKEAGRLDEAIQAYRQSMTLDPTDAAAHSNLIYIMHFHPRYSPSGILEEARAWERRFAIPLRSTIRPHQNERSPDRPLRIGYVSADFRDHVVGLNLLPLFRHHDRENYHISCYHNFAGVDTVTSEFQSLASQWRMIANLPDEAAAELIRNDRIDVLVDLSLHMGGNRLPLFARQPAPVQITFAGYPGTTGLSTIGYRLTDPYLDPAENDAFYSEESIRLPKSFWCYEALADQAPDVNPLPAEQNGFLTFGSLNNFCKINGPVLELWAKVLAAVPESRLVILATPGRHRQRTVDALNRLGIDPARIEFVGIQPRNDYLRYYHRLDIALDTFPYNGHTTSLDALWMGVPAVTLAGKSAVGRAGVSQLSNMGLPELIANSAEQYVRIASELANDVTRLSKLRAGMRERMRSSALMDGTGFARNVESALRTIWRRWCKE